MVVHWWGGRFMDGVDVAIWLHAVEVVIGVVFIGLCIHCIVGVLKS